MNTNDHLIKKTFIGIWIVTGTSMLFGIACVMIDAIMTGQFLGSKAVAATGLVQPVPSFP
jgi:Na+-driven multidrug efflux pump